MLSTVENTTTIMPKIKDYILLEEKTKTDKASNNNARGNIIKDHCTPILPGSGFYSGPLRGPLTQRSQKALPSDTPTAEHSSFYHQ